METIVLLTRCDDDTATRRREIERHEMLLLARALIAHSAQNAPIRSAAPAVLDPFGGGRKDSVH